jgi:hypothetical protein
MPNIDGKYYSSEDMKQMVIWLQKQEQDYINGTGKMVHNSPKRASWERLRNRPEWAEFISSVKAPNN